ncbi:hypothetical protein GF406_22465 [candidate division KSB1 bacterium]|nr:hypothetical protein [candidate division KSB1 bacterium]
MLYIGRELFQPIIFQTIFYGQITARLGLFFKVSKLIGSTVYGAGFFELSYGRLPTFDVLQFKDPQEDIDSIRSGYHDYLDNDPWKNGDSYGLDPKRPYPKDYFQMVQIKEE